jgi:hypothetical protein
MLLKYVINPDYSGLFLFSMQLQVHVNEQVEKRQPKLIRRVTGQARPTVMMGSNGSALPSPTPQQQSSQVAELAPHHGPGPYSPHSQSFYGAGDGTYYQHDAVVEDAERKSSRS